jgi:hypothetical protein
LYTLENTKIEIFWYFNNFDNEYVNSSKFKKKEKNFDHAIAELIWLFKRCWQTISNFKSEIITITNYNLKELIENIKALVSFHLNSKGSEAASTTEKIDLEKILCLLNEEESNYAQLRSSCEQFKLNTLISNSTGYSKFADLFSEFKLFETESLFIDQFDELVFEKSSLKELYFYQNNLIDQFKDLLEISAPESVKYAISYVMIATDFTENYVCIVPGNVILN